MSKLHDARKLPIFIHSQIDDMTDLTPNAMRVYMHLARRADKSGVAWPSYKSIGDHCFKSVSDNPATRKSFARKAIDDLVAAGLIERRARKDEDGSHSSNDYILLDPMPIDTPMLNKHTPMPIDTPLCLISTKDTPSENTPIEGEGDRGAALAAATQVSPQQELFGAVCEAVGWDYRTLTKEDQGQVAQTCGILGKAGYAAGDVATFMQTVWFKDWRWQKNQALPTIKQLRQEIGKIRSTVPAAAPASVGKNLQGVADYINRQRSAS